MTGHGVSRSERLMATWSCPRGAPTMAAAASAAVTPGTTVMSETGSNPGWDGASSNTSEARRYTRRLPSRPARPGVPRPPQPGRPRPGRPRRRWGADHPGVRRHRIGGQIDVWAVADDHVGTAHGGGGRRRAVAGLARSEADDPQVPGRPGPAGHREGRRRGPTLGDHQLGGGSPGEERGGLRHAGLRPPPLPRHSGSAPPLRPGMPP